jgi:hypothetical protein
VGRWLVGVVGLGAELHQRPHAARGALLPFEWLRKTRGARPWGWGTAYPKAWPGWQGYAHCSREGQEDQSNGFATTHTHALLDVQAARRKRSHSCASDQVVIARPPVLTPPRRYRRSLVSKGRFAISINVICVGIRSGLPKRRHMRYRISRDGGDGLRR